MAESIGATARTEDTNTELELSAQELLEISAVRHMDERGARPALPASRPAKRPSARKLALPLSLIAAVGIVGTTYVLTRSDGANQSAATTAQQIAQSQWPPPQQFAEGEPVRFANPFDTDEVFEFPPGTTETEARDTVAEVLLKRAISRQKT